MIQGPSGRVAIQRESYAAVIAAVQGKEIQWRSYYLHQNQ